MKLHKKKLPYSGAPLKKINKKHLSTVREAYLESTTALIFNSAITVSEYLHVFRLRFLQ